MTAHPDNLTPATPIHTPTRITVGNGSSLPITHVGHMSFPSTSTPLSLSNILVSPHLIKNLVSIRCLTRENPVTVEFDELGFCVKDARTRMVLHRCDSPDALSGAFTVHLHHRTDCSLRRRRSLARSFGSSQPRHTLSYS